MDLKEELKKLQQEKFIPYSKMAEMVKVKPTSFYQWLYGNTTLAKGKKLLLEKYVEKEKANDYFKLL